MPSSSTHWLSSWLGWKARWEERARRGQGGGRVHNVRVVATGAHIWTFVLLFSKVLVQRVESMIPAFLWLSPEVMRRALENVVAMRHRFFDDRILWNLSK